MKFVVSRVAKGESKNEKLVLLHRVLHYSTLDSAYAMQARKDEVDARVGRSFRRICSAMCAGASVCAEMRRGKRAWARERQVNMGARGYEHARSSSSSSNSSVERGSAGARERARSGHAENHKSVSESESAPAPGVPWPKREVANCPNVEDAASFTRAHRVVAGPVRSPVNPNS